MGNDLCVSTSSVKAKVRDFLNCLLSWKNKVAWADYLRVTLGWTTGINVESKFRNASCWFLFLTDFSVENICRS